MSRTHRLGLAALVLALFAAGCTGGPAGGRGGEEHIKANLAQLGEEDRKVAAAQRWCPVTDDTRLGEVGVPVKVVLKQEPVFLCCKSCIREAQKNPDKTLAKLHEVRAKAAANPGS